MAKVVESAVTSKFAEIGGLMMKLVHILSLLPFIGMLAFLPQVNKVEPLVFGLPFNMFWIVLWVVLTSAALAVIYRIDPDNREGDV